MSLALVEVAHDDAELHQVVDGKPAVRNAERDQPRGGLLAKRKGRSDVSGETGDRGHAFNGCSTPQFVVEDLRDLGELLGQRCGAIDALDSRSHEHGAEEGSGPVLRGRRRSRQHLREPLESLPEMPERLELLRGGRSELDDGRDVAALQRPGEGAPDVVDLDEKAVGQTRTPEPRIHDHAVWCPEDLAIDLGVASLRRLLLVVSPEQVEGVLPDWFQHDEQTLADGAQHRRLDEPAQRVEHAAAAVGKDAVVALGRVERERTTEHGQPPQQRLLDRTEQPVAPIDRGAHRMVMTHRPGRSSGEQRELVVEAGAELCERDHVQPRCGELDRQRQAAEAAAHLSDAGHCDGCLVDRSSCGPRPVAEKTDGGREDAGGLVDLGFERLGPPDHFSLDGQRPATRHDDAHLGALGEERRDQRSDAGCHVFAVVHHQQGAAFPEMGRRSFNEARLPGTFRHTEDAGSSRGNQFVPHHTAELDEPSAVGEVAGERSRGLDRKPALPDAACAHKGDEAPPTNQITHGSDVGFSPNETRQG